MLYQALNPTTDMRCGVKSNKTGRLPSVLAYQRASLLCMPGQLCVKCTCSTEGRAASRFSHTRQGLPSMQAAGLLQMCLLLSPTQLCLHSNSEMPSTWALYTDLVHSQRFSTLLQRQ